jgi:porin
MKKVTVILLVVALFEISLYANSGNPIVKDSISGSYTGDLFANVAGGIQKGEGYLGMGTLGVQLEFPKDGKLFIKGVVTHGKSPSGDYIGDRQVASNIEAGNHVYVQELWYSHRINQFEFTAGLQDLNQNFMANEIGDFMNSSFGIPPVSSDECPLPIFPLTGLGIAGQWDINDNYTAKAVIFDGNQTPFEHNPHNLNWEIAPGDGFLVVAELQAKTKIKDREGIYKVGGYYHFGSKEDIETQAMNSNRNFGAYFIGNLSLNDRWEVFSQIVVGSKNSGTVNPYLGLGATCKYGEANTFGLAVAHDGVYDKKYQHETAIELFYKRILTDYITIKPDIQYIINPSGTDSKLKNALAGFVRLEINF